MCRVKFDLHILQVTDRYCQVHIFFDLNPFHGRNLDYSHANTENTRADIPEYKIIAYKEIK